MSDKRMAGDYEIIQAVTVGDAEVVVGYDPNEAQGHYYMTALCERNAILTRYDQVLASDSYPEILGIFGNRIAEQSKQLEAQLKQENIDAPDNRPLDENRCSNISGCRLISHEDDLNGKVVIIRPDVLKYEYQRATRQLMLCTGGFGASPHSRGSACYCTNLYSGDSGRFERRDVLAILNPEQVPKWGRAVLEQAMQKDSPKKNRAEVAL